MKKLVLYYSRTGNTRFIAEEIALNIKADIEEIREKKSRKGILGWLGAGKDAFKELPADIDKLKHDPKKYDRIFIGQPVWAGKMNPAIRALIQKYDFSKKKVVLFCSMGGDHDDKCLRQTKEKLGSVLAAKAFTNPKRSPELTKENVKELLASISSSRSPAPDKASL